MEEEEEEEEEEVNTCLSCQIFNEKDGIVRVDLVNPSTTDNGWASGTSLSGFEGAGYLIWTDSDSFSNPGQGEMKFSIKITTTGVYQFVWKSRIGKGDSSTEHNDSWLKINGEDFYGEKASTGDRVYPKGSGKTPNPEGASKDGWLKNYMNNKTVWLWRSNTNDKDPFNIFVKFDKEGIYDVQISGRSNSHAIDQFVLFRTDKSLTVAQNAALSEITIK
tara:strand:- start:3096 stop:3752 length:657 start_codon:yes stop_codon:yes gene_type:complete